MATSASNALVYDPRYHTFESWACLMVEQYGAQNLEIPNSLTNWQHWGAGLKTIDIFSSEAVPNPYQFSDWHEWASQLLNAMNGNA